METAAQAEAAMRESERRYRASEARYRAIFDSIDEGFAIAEVLYDDDGRPVDALYLEANAAASRLTGVSDYAGRRLSDVMPGAEQYWLEIYDRVARTGVAHRLERYLAPIERWCGFHIACVADGTRGAVAGGPPWVAIVFQDITARRQTEHALRASETRFRAVADLAPDLLWESAPDGSTVWHNARWMEYTGQSLDEASGWGWTEAIHPDDRARSARAVERGEALVQEHRIRRHDGAYRWFLVREEPLRDDTGRIVRWFGAATDVHAQRMALEEAERLAAERTAERDLARRQLLEVEEVERRRLARELHDEAGQHLVALGLGLQTLSDMATPGSEVDRRATQLRELTATMSRELHSLAVRLRPKSLDDFGLEAALVAYVEEWSRQTGVAVGVHARAGAARLPSAIESAVYRVVQEALTNVARHSGAERASVIVERRDGQVVAIVEDDGRGFDPEALARMPRDGVGLGLPGVYERAALLGGTADVESTPGGGTTVFVRIPIDR